MMQLNAINQTNFNIPNARQITTIDRQIIRKPWVEIADATGPMSAIRDQRILVIADAENLTYSAKDLGFRISYKKLGDMLRQTASNCILHAFFSCKNGDDRWSKYFTNRGWTPHKKDIETIKTHQGIKQMANSDNMILFNAGMLISRSTANVVVLASGDGSMVCDIAKAVSMLPKPRTVVTMSLAGSTSWRLNAEDNQYISCNIEIGKNCLREYSERR